MTTILVGVLNVTPDSFSDGGRFSTVDDAVAAGLRMVEEGADWLDVGGESTRPGATPISEEDEKARVVPVIAALAAALSKRGRLGEPGTPGAPARLSVDTYKAGTARAALAAGATVVNDVSGGRLDPAILEVAAEAGAAFVAGHMRGTPATMAGEAHYQDVVAEVVTELRASLEGARRTGVPELWADPGIGFAKTTAHNLTLLRELSALRQALGVPLMVGVSRKRFLGDLTGRAASERVFGTAAAVTAAVLAGADAVRVHDVAAMRDVVLVATALRRTAPG